MAVSLDTRSDLWSAVGCTRDSSSQKSFNEGTSNDSLVTPRQRSMLQQNNDTHYSYDNIYDAVGYKPSSKIFETDSEDSGTVCCGSSSDEIYGEIPPKYQERFRRTDITFSQRFGHRFKTDIPPPMMRSGGPFIYMSSEYFSNSSKDLEFYYPEIYV